MTLGRLRRLGLLVWVGSVAPAFGFVPSAPLLPFTKKQSLSWTASTHQHSVKASCGRQLALSSSGFEEGSEHALDQLLRKHEASTRLRTLSEGVILEIFQNGKAEIARLHDFTWQSKPGHFWTEPKLRVQVLTCEEGESKSVIAIDLGQVTTVWDDDEKLTLGAAKRTMEPSSVPISVLERVFDRIHATTVRKGRKSRANALTKKNIAAEAFRVATVITTTDSSGPNDKDVPQESFEILAHVQQLLRKLQKVGAGYARLVDSAVLANALIRERNDNRFSGQHFSTVRVLAAQLLARDAKEGGRFKRWPVVLVRSSQAVNTATVLNGGWLVQDQSVRTAQEVDKLVSKSSSNPSGSSGTQVGTSTRADGRILQRLECLAMGERLDGAAAEEGKYLDVRRTLSSLTLPLTPKGAQEALVRLGRWSNSDMALATFQPWPTNVIEAAARYASLGPDYWIEVEQGGRVDLMNLPCICIDAKGTTFRDDALGLRPRKSTNRPVDPAVSNWEVLVHIADVSDLYTAEQHLLPQTLQNDLVVLRDAARSRGESRYDLPFGPLHLLPPMVLKALGFSEKKECQRCVTLWAYIDENSGKLVDTGIERTLVSRPRTLSYEDASLLLEDDSSGGRERALLLMLGRLLQKWSASRRERSLAAEKREARLMKRETEGQGIGEWGDNGATNFRRTSAHRLVDAALSLYALAGTRLLRKANAPVPFARGAGFSEGGRVATAPLRRYIDGECQRQLLAAVAGYGSVMSAAACRKVGNVANESRNKIAKNQAARKKQ